jgi:hypothetical protein
VISDINSNMFLICMPILAFIIFKTIDRYYVQPKPAIFIPFNEKYEVYYDQGFVEMRMGREYYFSLIISVILCIFGIVMINNYIDFSLTQNPLGVYDSLWGWLAFTLLSSIIIVAGIGAIHIVSLMVFADMTKYEIQAFEKIMHSPLSDLFSGENMRGDRAKFLKGYGYLELEWGSGDLFIRLKQFVNSVIGFNIANVVLFCSLWLILVPVVTTTEPSTSSIQLYYSIIVICFFSYYHHNQHIGASLSRVEKFTINRLADEFSEEYRSLISKKTEEE